MAKGPAVLARDEWHDVQLAQLGRGPGPRSLFISALPCAGSLSIISASHQEPDFVDSLH